MPIPVVSPGNEIRICEATGVAAIISPKRRIRPHGFHQGTDSPPNPFAEGNEHLTLPETAAIRAEGTAPDSPGWRVRVVGNKYPLLSPEDAPAGYGFHEVLIECTNPECDLADLGDEHGLDVLKLLRDRVAAMEAMRGVKSVVAFRNSGAAAGASLPHPHMQMLALPMVPPSLEQAGQRFSKWRQEHAESWFSAASNGSEAVVLERTARFAAVLPNAPRVPYEVLVFPSEERARFSEEDGERLAEFAELLLRTLRRLRAALGNPPYNLVFESAPCGLADAAGWHWNVAILPRRGHFGGFEWATGMWVSSVTPEDAAKHLLGVSSLGE